MCFPLHQRNIGWLFKEKLTKNSVSPHLSGQGWSHTSKSYDKHAVPYLPGFLSKVAGSQTPAFYHHIAVGIRTQFYFLTWKNLRLNKPRDVSRDSAPRCVVLYYTQHEAEVKRILGFFKKIFWGFIRRKGPLLTSWYNPVLQWIYKLFNHQTQYITNLNNCSLTDICSGAGRLFWSIRLGGWR